MGMIADGTSHINLGTRERNEEMMARRRFSGEQHGNSPYSIISLNIYFLRHAFQYMPKFSNQKFPTDLGCYEGELLLREEVEVVFPEE